MFRDTAMNAMYYSMDTKAVIRTWLSRVQNT